MDVIISIIGTCEGGNHVFVNVTKGGETQQRSFLKQDFLNDDPDFRIESEDKAILKQVRRIAKVEGIKTFAALVNRCTNLSLSL